jgi:heme exporter protein B
MFRDAALIAGKDLRLEARARVALNQVAPFALLVLVLFAFALDPDRGVLDRATPGLYWTAVLLSALLAVQRAFSVEAADGVRDGLRLSALDPAGIFVGKVLAIGIQLLVLEGLLLVGVIVLYDADPGGIALVAPTCVAATVGLAAAGSLYGVLSAGLRVKETILPLLLLPVVAPVLIAATQAFEAGFDDRMGEGWRWLGLLVVFAAAYIGLGLLVFDTLLEEA